MSNPLVAPREDSTEAYTGIGIVESAVDTYNGISSGNWVEGGLGLAGAGLETLGLVIDPVGTLVGYGVSWLMEHVKPLSDALDWLAGDPDTIASYAQTWRNVSQAIGQAKTDFDTAVTNDTAAWTGTAADAYRQQAAGQAEQISAAATSADTVGTVVEVVGVLVGVVREVVRDLIADCVATLIARIPQWLAEIAGTLGIATPHVVASAVALISKWVARISEVITKLVRSVNNLMPLLRRLDEIWAAIKNGFRGLSPSGPSTPNSPSSTTPSGTSPVSDPNSVTPPTVNSSTTAPTSTTGPTPTSPSAAPTVSPDASPTTTAPASTTPSSVSDAPTVAPAEPPGASPTSPPTHFGHADRDPLRRHGAGRETHPQEWQDALDYARANGVEVIERPGAMAYGPSPSSGNPGQLIIDPDASIGALRHEMQHLLDDQAAGWPGMRVMFEDPERAFQMEVRAYQREIEYAESIGDHESAEMLRGFIEQERLRWLGPGE